jgi:hypothetical protein
MDPMQVAARFTAFTAYLNATTGQAVSPEQAGNFARQNWKGFLRFVDRDLARFLTTRPRSRRARTVRNLPATRKTLRANTAV